MSVPVEQKVVSPPTKKELRELTQDYIVLCDKIPPAFISKGATFLLRCNLCQQYLEAVQGAKGHAQGKRHTEKKILKKFDELKLVGSPDEEQFDAISVKLQQVYDEWSAEACGQQIVRDKIVSEFQEFVQQIKGCEDVIVELFGSTYTGFALKDSDINMNLRFSNHSINDSQSSYHTVISGLVERLTAMVDSGSDDVMYTDLKNDLYSTSVSHITFTHQPSGLSCHIRYGSHHKAPICTGKLLQRYGAVDDRVKVLGVVLKYWAKLCQLDIQQLGSYPSQMFVLMLVHFLQHRSPPILPVPPKPNDFSETQQCLEHFDEYLSGLDHMIQTWKVNNTESLGVLWMELLRFYCEEEALEKLVVQVTENDFLLKNSTSWSHYKQLVVLSPTNPFHNIARACSSRKMYLYLGACFKTTFISFGQAFLDKSSITPSSKGQSKPQDVTSHDPCVTEEIASTTVKSPKHATCYTDVASQLSNFDDDEPIRSEDYLNDSDMLNQTLQTTTGSHDLDCDTSYDLDHDGSLDPGPDASHDLDRDGTSEVETSREHKNSHHGTKLHYEFISSNFTPKKLPEVCLLCKREDHIFTSPSCPSKKTNIDLACHPPLAFRELQELDKVFVSLKENICLKPEDRALRRGICSIIEYHVKAVYPEAQLVLFGSSANEFGSSNSDIDISMRLPGNYEHDGNAKIIEGVAAHLRQVPYQQDWLVDSIQAITTARVPLVKVTLTQKWNGLECDISLGNYLALHNTELLASYANIDKRVQVMGYVLKEFAKSSEMCDASSGSLSSYAYIILLLHYLQQVKPPVIPVLQQMGERGHIVVDGWNCWFYQFDDLSQLEAIWPHVGENKKTVGELLINFFKYYLKEFDWQRHVVCVRQLEPLNKVEKEWASKQVCIEDPFDQDHNLSSHLTKKMWSYICNAFKCAHDHITNPHLYTQQRPLTIEAVLSVGFAKNVPQDGLCYICGKRGHGFYNCPNKNANNVSHLSGKKGQPPGHVQRCHGHVMQPFVVGNYLVPYPDARLDGQYAKPVANTRAFTTILPHGRVPPPVRPQITKPATVGYAIPLHNTTIRALPNGRPLVPDRSQYRSPVAIDPTALDSIDSSRRVYHQQQGGNRGRTTAPSRPQSTRPAAVDPILDSSRRSHQQQGGNRGRAAAPGRPQSTRPAAVDPILDSSRRTHQQQGGNRGRTLNNVHHHQSKQRHHQQDRRSWTK